MIARPHRLMMSRDGAPHSARGTPASADGARRGQPAQYLNERFVCDPATRSALGRYLNVQRIKQARTHVVYKANALVYMVY